jgi:hypothetical protein
MRKLSIDEINSRLLSRGLRLIGNYSGTGTKTTFSCVHEHTWEAIPSSVMSGNGCFYCSGKAPLSKSKINDILLKREIQLEGEYLGALQLTSFRCSCGNIWKTTPNNIISGKGCGACSPHGFRINKPGYAYLLNFGNFIKYGITNNLEQRLKQHNKNGKFELVWSSSFSVGKQALEWENTIKKTFGGRFVDKTKCPDGFTETLNLEHLSHVLKLSETLILNS